MVPEPATQGISVVGEMPWRTHSCYFHETQQDRFDASVAFLQAGLDNHEFGLWIVHSPVAEAEALQALQTSIPALDRYMAEGAIEIFVDPDRCASVRTLREKLDQAMARGFAGMRVAAGPASREFERELDRSIANYRMIALCLFPLAESSAVEIVDATRRISASSQGVRMTGRC